MGFFKLKGYKKLISIISAMLKAEVAGIGFPERGTPQGGIISPLLSNIVLNEFDWWITSQWENMPTRKKLEFVRNDNGVLDKANKYVALRKASNLKECYIVRYADDFKIFCRNRQDAEKLFHAVRDWLKVRLGLEINPAKSRIINLRKKASEFLGIELKAVVKGKKTNGSNKYVVKSHMNHKAIKRVKENLRPLIKGIQNPANKDEEYKAVQAYNAYVSGVHNYYRYATHISKDIRKIALGVNRTLNNRLKERLKTSGNPLPAYIAKGYGKSKQLRYVGGHPIIPIGYIQTKAPLYKRRNICKFTPEGRKMIHNNLDSVDTNILHYMMRNPVKGASVEYNDNRLSLFCAQYGKCHISGIKLEIGDIYCHHKVPRSLGGTDRYSNLVLVCEKIHILIHATSDDTISKIIKEYKLDRDKIRKLNTLRKKAGLPLVG